MILARYFLTTYARLALIFLCGLIAIDFIFRSVKYLGMAAESRIAGNDVFSLLFLKMAVGLAELVPLGLFLATFATVIGLRRSNEFVAMLAAGFSGLSMVRLILGVSAFAALSVATITLWLEPEIEMRIFEIRSASEENAEISGVRPGVFRTMSGGDSILYAERLSDSEEYLEQAFVESSAGDRRQVSKSQKAFVQVNPDSGERLAIFERGKNIVGEAGDANFTITEFDRYAVVLERKAASSPTGHENYKSSDEIFLDPDPRSRAEFHWRLALPIATLIAPLIAFGAALRTNAENWHLNIVLALALYFLYINILGIGRNWIKDASINPQLGLWWVHGAVLLTTMILLYLELRPSPVLHRQLKVLIPRPLR